MTKNKEEKSRPKTWSVARIKHPKSEYTFRVGEYVDGGAMKKMMAGMDIKPSGDVEL